MENPGNHDQVAVTVSFRPVGPVCLTRRNLRLDGMFVDTGATALPHHSQVEVTLTVTRDSQLQVHTLNALVMGRSRLGTNLAFQNCRRETYELLQEILGGPRGLAST